MAIKNFKIEKQLVYLRQSAWNVKRFIQTKIKQQKNTFHQRLHMERNSNDFFFQWLVGFTDGDGCFSIYLNNNKVTLIYKISVSIYNIRAIYYIKKNLGVGSITWDKKNNMVSFTIRSLNLFESIIIPIFDKYPLLTHKYYDYLRIKQAYSIMKDAHINQSEKCLLIEQLVNQDLKKNDNLFSPVFNNINLDTINHNQAQEIMSKAWLIGFIEAEGSFYITKKDKNRWCHGFCITQKHDQIVLQIIRKVLHIKSKIRFRQPKNFKNDQGFYILDTTNKRAILNICKYLTNNLKTIKSLEFKIWKKCFEQIEAYGCTKRLPNDDLSAISKARTAKIEQKKLLATQQRLRRLRKTSPVFSPITKQD